MTAPLQFPERRSKDAQLRAAVLAQCLDVTLTKGDRRRRYWIRPGKRLGEWYCQVWFGEKTQHRGDATEDFTQVQRFKAECFREINELEQDGWSITAGVDPRPTRSV